MNVVIKNFKLYIIFIIINIVFLNASQELENKSNASSPKIENNKSFTYQLTTGYKSMSLSINEIAPRYHIINLVIPVLGWYNFFKATENLMHFYKLKLPPFIPILESRIPWIKLLLTALAITIKPKYNFHEGLNFFSSTATPNALFEDSINSLDSSLTKLDKNNPDEKEKMEKIYNIKKQIEEII